MSYLNSTGIPRLVLDLKNRLVPMVRKINGKTLNADITLSSADIGYSNSDLPGVKNVEDMLGTLNEKKADASDTEIALQIANHIYPGVDLTTKFAAEINGYPDPWKWIRDRIRAGDYDGIHTHDYIPLTLTDGKTFKMEVPGLDTYRRYGSVEVGHHIDFISRDCHPDTHVWNKVNQNNGIAAVQHPWLCSDLDAWLNSRQTNVPNATTADPATVAVDYRTTGVYDKLPQAVKDVIVTKSILLPRRYSAGVLLIDDNLWDWKGLGPLWIPSEVEVYGCPMWGTRLNGNAYGSGGYVQYPIFANTITRIKGAGDGGARSAWWLSSALGGTSTYCAFVGGDGVAGNYPASAAGIRAPLCFRVA